MRGEMRFRGRAFDEARHGGNAPIPAGKGRAAHEAALPSDRKNQPPTASLTHFFV